MPKTPGKMHMYDMVKIDTIVFKIVGGGALKAPPPPPGSLAVWNSPDRTGLRLSAASQRNKKYIKFVHIRPYNFKK